MLETVNITAARKRRKRIPCDSITPISEYLFSPLRRAMMIWAPMPNPNPNMKIEI